MDIEHLYHQYKPLLFSIAYRMLGSVADAEDMVQDTFMNAQQLEPEQMRHARAYLCKMVTNRCIDYAQSARKRRELYVGQWLPEPLMLSDNDPLHAVEREETLSYAFLVYMEKLKPVERAIFILREAFEYDYADIGDIIGKSETNCRQIFSRLKKKLHDEQQSRIHAAGPVRSNLAEQFLHAANTGDMELFLRSLTEDVVVYSDGGGKANAAIRPIPGRERVTKFLLGISAKYAETQTYHIAPINGEDAILVAEQGKIVTAIQFEMDERGGIRHIFFMRNPDKLQGLYIP